MTDKALSGFQNVYLILIFDIIDSDNLSGRQTFSRLAPFLGRNTLDYMKVETKFGVEYHTFQFHFILTLPEFISVHTYSLNA